MLKKFVFLLILILSTGCIASNKDKQNKKITDQLELQEEIQRFYTRFTERLAEISFTGKHLLEDHGETARSEYMLYDSEALKITTGPYPVVNLLDMLVFIKLNKIVVRDYWVPKVYGKEGLLIYNAFADSEKDLELVASKIITPEKMAELDEGIQEWRQENPNKIRVEKIRLADFSRYAKVDDSKRNSFSLSNLFVDTKSAVQAVDQMVLVANRGIFLSQHIPLLIRFQARIGVQEIISDTVNRLQSAPRILGELNKAEPLVQNLSTLTRELDLLARDTLSLVNGSRKHFPKGVDINQGLAQMNSLLDKTNIVLRQLQLQRPLNQKMLHNLKNEFRGMIWFIALMIILVGIIISAAWWTGSYISKRKLSH